MQKVISICIIGMLAAVVGAAMGLALAEYLYGDLVQLGARMLARVR